MSQHTCYYFAVDPEICSNEQAFEYSSIFPFDEYSSEYIEVSFTASLPEDWFIRVYYQKPGDTSRREYPELAYNETFPLTPEENPLTVRADNFEIRLSIRDDVDRCYPYCVSPLNYVSGLVTTVIANEKPKGSTRLLLRAVEPEGSGTTFTYNTANVTGFAVAESGLVTPPTAEVGYINRKTYSAGYSAGYYPTPITSSISRSVEVQVTAPNYFLNAGSIVSGSEYAVQAATGTPNTGSWSTGTNSNFAHQSGQILVGTQTATLLFGGNTQKTEEWNGSSWSTTGDHPATNYRFFGAVGTQNDALSIGGDTNNSGSDVSHVWDYNGATWSVGTPLIQGRSNNAAAGTTSDALTLGGRPSAAGNSTEEWNGISWSTGGNYFIRIDNVAMFGNSSTSITAAAGNAYDIATLQNVAYNYDGAVWNQTGTMVTSRNYSAGIGPQTNGLVVGGQGATSGGVANVESFNGYAWSTANSVPDPDNSFRPGGAGTGAAGIASFANSALTYNYHYELN